MLVRLAARQYGAAPSVSYPHFAPLAHIRMPPPPCPPPPPSPQVVVRSFAIEQQAVGVRRRTRELSSLDLAVAAVSSGSSSGSSSRRQLLQSGAGTTVALLATFDVLDTQVGEKGKGWGRGACDVCVCVRKALCRGVVLCVRMTAFGCARGWMDEWVGGWA